MTCNDVFADVARASSAAELVTIWSRLRGTSASAASAACRPTPSSRCEYVSAVRVMESAPAPSRRCPGRRRLPASARPDHGAGHEAGSGESLTLVPVRIRASSDAAPSCARVRRRARHPARQRTGTSEESHVRALLVPGHHLLVVRQQVGQVDGRSRPCGTCRRDHRGIVFGGPKTASGDARRVDLGERGVGVPLAQRLTHAVSAAEPPTRCSSAGGSPILT